MSLNKCKVCGHDAVEEIRGIHHKDGVNPRNDKEVVENLGSEHNNDFRVHCTNCSNSTGWDRADTEQFVNRGPGDVRRETIQRDGNLDNVRKRWNDANPLAA